MDRRLKIGMAVLGVAGLVVLFSTAGRDCASDVVDQFWGQTRNGLTLGSIYAMIALGYTMVYGVLQLINFAHSEVFMVATVASLYAFRDWFNVGDPIGGIGLIVVLLATLVICMIASGATAVALERLAYRPLRKRGAPRLSYLISAIGASLFIQYLFRLMDGQHHLFFLGWFGGPYLPLPDILGPSPIAIPLPMETETAFTLFDTAVSNKRVLVVVVALIMLFVLDRFVNQTKLGRGIRAVAQDAETASMMGVNINRVIVVTFLVGGMMAGAAGLLYILVLGVPTSFVIGFQPGIKAFIAAVLGGIGNIRGAMLGGLLLGVVEAYSVPCFGEQWKNVTAYSVLVLVLMFRPTGILGERVGT